MNYMHIWAHMSIAGGLHLAFERSAQIGGSSLQVFSKSPRWWSLPSYTEEDFAVAREFRGRYKQQGWLIHSNYLANLSKPAEECQNDIKSILHDFYVGEQTGFEAINIHIGKQKWFDTRDAAFKNMTKNAEYILEQNKKHWYKPLFLFEITAWQGSELWTTIEELGYFYKNYLHDLPIKFCFDTAHAWWAGNDLSDWNRIIWQWDDQIGIDNLYAFHLNDAKVALWSHLDRHAPLGRWAIGRENLVPIIQRAGKYAKWLYIETTDPSLWPEEIQHVRDIIAGNTKQVEELHTKHYQTELLKKFQQGGAQSLFD